MRNLMRVIDANLNRSMEGLRVCEDIVRFILNDKTAMRSFKSLRHRVAALAKKTYTHPGGGQGLARLKSRNIKKDVGKITTRREARRKNIGDVFRANIQRVKESLRVLEEISKLLDRKISQDFKKVRFRVYELEKKSCFKLEAVLHHR
jgi:thiamine-phosphate pyrophosphorylase